jgi:hypothetical protein
MPPRIETRSLVTIDRLGAALERRNAHVTVGDRAATICNPAFITRNRFQR